MKYLLGRRVRIIIRNKKMRKKARDDIVKDLMAHGYALDSDGIWHLEKGKKK